MIPEGQDQKAYLDSLLAQEPTPEEQKAKLDSLLKTSPPPKMGEAWYEDPVMAARAFLQGQTLGWSDEAGAAVAAGMARLTGQADDYGTAYRDILGTLEHQRQEWAGEHPVANLGLNLAGGFSTAGAGGGRVLATESVKNAGRLGKAGASVGVGLGEGVIAGAGASSPGQRASGAAFGGAVGAAIPGAVAGVRPAAELVASGVKQIPQQLGKGLDFIPLNMADEGFLGNFYRTVIGQGMGSKRTMQDQSGRVVAAIARTRDFAKDKLAEANNQVKTVLKAAKSGAKHAESRVNTAAALSVGEAKDVAEKTFRRAAIIEATPMGLGEETRAVLSGKPAHEAMEKLDEFWASDGFKVVKERDFDVNETELFDELAKVLDDDAALENVMREFLEPLRTVFRKGFTRQAALPNPKAGPNPNGWQFDTPTETLANPVGTINGDSFMEMRNLLARMSNAAAPGGQGALLGHAAGRIASLVDDKIKGQLNPSELAAYNDELSRWGTMKILREATVRAGKKRGGEFTPNDWLSVAGDKSKYRKAQGPLQKEAMETQRTLVEADEHLKRTALLAKKARDKAIAKAEMKAKMKPRARGLEQKVEQATAQHKAVSSLAPTAQTSLFETLFNTGLMGFGFGFGNLLSGTAVGRVAASPSVQRALVGQSSPQAALRKGLDAYEDIAPTARELGRAVTRTSAQQ